MKKKIIFTVIGFALLANVSAQLKVNSVGEVQAEKLFVNKPNRTTNWNNLWQSGFYDSYDATNAPESSGWFWGINMNHTSNSPTYRYGGQIAIRNSNVSPTMYFRSTDANGIGTWAKVLHSVGNQTINGNMNVNGILWNSNDAFISYDGKSFGHYSLGWYWDTWTTQGPSLWCSSFGGMKFFTAGNPRLFIHSNGNVGIGRNPTAGMLDVNGNIAIKGSVKVSSDERLKKEIKPLIDEQNRLYLLEGKSYKKTLPPTGLEEVSSDPQREEIIEFPEYGYFAQELKEIFPDLVSQDSASYYSINYIGLIPIIVEALKDQKLTIENLQKEIQERTEYPEESKINELLQRVESLERALAMCCNTNQLRSTETSFQQFELTNPADSNQETMILYQNAPNPFNENTTIQCYIPQTVQKVQLCVYDMQGVQQKCLLIPERGTVSVQIQARQLAAGIYTYLLIGDDKASEAKQMILTR